MKGRNLFLLESIEQGRGGTGGFDHLLPEGGQALAGKNGGMQVGVFTARMNMRVGTVPVPVCPTGGTIPVPFCPMMVARKSAMISKRTSFRDGQVSYCAARRGHSDLGENAPVPYPRCFAIH